MKLHISSVPFWKQVGTAVCLSVVAITLLSGCGAEAVKPPLEDNTAKGAAPGGVSTDDYAKKMKELQKSK